MESQEIRKIFLDFFKGKGHTIVPSSSLIPADSTVLFTSAGMQQFIPYLKGDVEPPFSRAASSQKCFRTTDIDEVGDSSHHTFFEMMGNWSFGRGKDNYFKKEAIELALELLENKFFLAKDKFWVTIFKGEGEIPYDKESFLLWQKNGIPQERIKSFGMEDNFWGPVTETGPCGPCSEIHYDQGEKFKKRKCSLKGCGPNCACGRFIEIWNLVFMEYDKKIAGDKEIYEPLPSKNIDTGAGLERLTSILQNKESDYETELFTEVIEKISRLSGISYEENKKAYRVIADHLRGSCFLIADGVLPSREDRGYILRRILRRAMRYGKILGLPRNFLIPLAEIFISQYQDVYHELSLKKNDILTVLQNEEDRFGKTLQEGLKQFERAVKDLLGKGEKIIPGEISFRLFESYGFPFELTEEMAEEKGLAVKKEDFDMAFKKHQEISRAGAKKKFGGLGITADESEDDIKKKIRLHTATHLLHQALRDTLGDTVRQGGSDINVERLRFDFTFHRKLTEEETKKVEEMVNRKIKEGLEVKHEEMPYEEAINKGALAFFKERYPQRVKVHSIGNYSKEVCAGPHVRNSRELGKFKILKVEKIGAGLIRVKAVLE
ncbi:alanine--tRNA ligase [bacterium (Candidatus Moisslbacteria) CG02_land_8_20_14_3_00_36_53]|nr:MAG: alanine--tRNA ligase [bacterium (Candidatus Moisslbacteria) CG02_land_8_20_14_3_00_36_53]